MVRFQSHCTANYHILTVVAGSKQKLEGKKKKPKVVNRTKKKGQLKAGRRESRSKIQKKRKKRQYV